MESELYIKFLKRNLWLMLLPFIICLGISIFLYSTESAKTRLFQVYRMNYDLENAEVKMALTDTAVSEIRLQNLEAGFENSKATVYKSSPLDIAIDVVALDKNQGYELLIKITNFLRTNFSVSEITPVQIFLVEPSLLKYLIGGVFFRNFNRPGYIAYQGIF